jgi:hypothetical protein
MIFWNKKWNVIFVVILQFITTESGQSYLLKIMQSLGVLLNICFATDFHE